MITWTDILAVLIIVGALNMDKVLNYIGGKLNPPNRFDHR